MTERVTSRPSLWRRIASLPAVIGWGALFAMAGIFYQAAVTAPNSLNLVHRLADWRTSELSDRAQTLHPNVAVVLISDETLDRYPYTVPLDRLLLSQLVRALDAAGAKVIAPDVYFLKATDPARDKALLTALKEAKAKVVLAAIDERLGLTPAKREYQSQFITSAGRPAGYLNLQVDPDDVIRFRASSADRSAYAQSLAEAIIEAAGLKAQPVFQRIEWLLPPPGEASPFLTLPAEALLAGTPQNEKAEASGKLAALKDKIVLIGADFSTRDKHRTPLTPFGGKETPGVVVHAHSVAQLIDGRTRREVEAIYVYPLLAVLAAAGFLFGWRWRDNFRYLVIGGVLTLALVFADALMFALARIILPFGLWLGALVLGAVAGHTLHQARTIVQDKVRNPA